MGIRESIGELESVMSDLERSKSAKKASIIPDYDRRLGKIEESIGSIENEIKNMKDSIRSFFSDKNTIIELQKTMNMLQKAVLELQRKSESSAGISMQKDYQGKDKHITDAVKIINETVIKLNKDQERIKKDIDEKLSTISKGVDERINSRLNDFLKKTEITSNYGLNTGKKIDEKLKLFALNSDVEKIWKDMESLKKYINEKSKYAENLANNLHIWESRNARLAEKERKLEENLSIFPDLKVIEGRLRKIERGLMEMQRHFVAAKISEPIVME